MPVGLTPTAATNTVPGARRHARPKLTCCRTICDHMDPSQCRGLNRHVVASDLDVSLAGTACNGGWIDMP